jgi:hypothetical protein
MNACIIAIYSLTDCQHGITTAKKVNHKEEARENLSKETLPEMTKSG